MMYKFWTKYNIRLRYLGNCQFRQREWHVIFVGYSGELTTVKYKERPRMGPLVKWVAKPLRFPWLMAVLNPNAELHLC